MRPYFVPFVQSKKQCDEEKCACIYHSVSLFPLQAVREPAEEKEEVKEEEEE